MRLPGQKVSLARSTHHPDLVDVEDLLTRAARNEGAIHSKDLFRSKTDEIPHLVREEAYEKLLAVEDIRKALAVFKEWESLFITKPPYDYIKPGSYHHQNRSTRRIDALPEKVLEQKRNAWLSQAALLGLSGKDLKDLSWHPSVLQKMPSFVPRADDTVSTGIQLEEEVEVQVALEENMEIEIEQEREEELELDSCGDVPFYPPWIGLKPKEYIASDWLHSAFDKRLTFLENFLPVKRTDSLFKRTPFDRAMPPIHTLHFVFSWRSTTCSKAIFGDVLDDVIHRPQEYSGYKFEPITRDSGGVSYDLRTGKIVSGNPDAKLPEDLIAQARFINGQFEGYSRNEWDHLQYWISQNNPQKLKEFFEKTILRTKPAKAAAFVHSELYALFDKLIKKM